MEEKRRCALFVLVWMFWLQHCFGQGLSTRREGYFNGSSELHLPYSIDLNNLLSFSILTCTYGVFLHQEGSTGDSLELAIQENTGYLHLSWQASGYSDSVTLDRNLMDHNWHLIEFRPYLGQIILTVDGYSNRTIANSSSQYLKLIALQPPLKIGQGFRGCILRGNNLNFTMPDTHASNVKWNDCPPAQYQSCDGLGVNLCFSQPCRSGGRCFPTRTGYMCQCTTRYNGTNCELDLGPLCYKDENRCQNSGICREIDFGNHTVCECHPRFTGGRCENVITDFCFSSPCQNGGMCNQNSYNDSYVCICPGGFTGVNCEVRINECDRRPCRNDGTCISNDNGFICNCNNTGYRGDFCELDIDECAEMSPCLHGGSCLNVYGQYQCVCNPNYHGRNCEHELDECISNPCQNGGTCHNQDDGYSCMCRSGFIGVNCERIAKITCQGNDRNGTCRCRPGSSGIWPNCSDLNECNSNPCMNRGTCENLENTFRCSCSPGFTGNLCETNIDECQDTPCQNGASCVDGVGTYSCICGPGFTGKNCSTNIDDCEPNQCKNKAICTDLVNDFNCTCVPGWEGKVCDQDINECMSIPCLNGATCVDLPNDFNCTCKPGFSGKQCDVNIDDCASTSCLHGGTCIDLINNFHCNCTEMWMGKTCAETYDACAFSPCLNNATCNSISPLHEYTCACPSGFTGSFCETNIDDCMNVICPNGTICYDKINGHECTCPKGFQGPSCQTEINECLSNPCKNNSTCTDGVGNFTCTCNQGFTGLFCETDINECDPLPGPCKYGICQNSFGSYQCYCTPGYSGNTCSIDVDECLSNPCRNNASCLNQQNRYQCQCAPGYTGKNCETDINECASNPCSNGGTCQDQINKYSCLCIPGFTGTQCEVDIDDCAPRPCKNGGLCMDKINEFLCNCSDTGFTGSTCEINIDDCNPNQCINNGTCEDGVKDYKCTCHVGYTGNNCDIDIDECASNPCQHHGTCLQKSNTTLYQTNYLQLFSHFSYDTAGGYICICPPGLTGSNCELDIDECISSPCQNSGTCLDRINGYSCFCKAGFEGANCEKNIDECVRYKPCKHNGSCVDLVADYRCECTSTYGGRNCTVELLGCQNHVCQNDGICVPFLTGEDVHNYTCNCLPAFYGFYCNVATSVSFNGASLALLHIPINPYGLSLMFRTTVGSGLLATGFTDELTAYYFLELQNGTLILKYSHNNNVGDSPIKVGTKLNNGEWHRVILSISSGTINITLSSKNQNQTQLQHIPESRTLIFGNTSFGGIPSGLVLPPTVRPSPNYVGCLQDIFFGPTLIIPQIITNVGINISVGCNRTSQCLSETCHLRGECNDLWITFSCNCHRPFSGKTCKDSFTPGTFGYQNALSYSTVPLNDVNYSTFNDVSLFLRTRQPNGLILFWGNLPAPSNSVHTYLIIELLRGRLQITVKLSASPQQFYSGPKLNNGRYHFVQVVRNGSSLVASINGSEILETDINATYGLHAEKLFLGGVPSLSESSRNKRQVVENTDSIPSVIPFKGILQDVRINDKLIPFFPQNHLTSNSPSLFQDVEINGVQRGVLSDPMCDSNPCQNSGLCNVTWNDFECTCPSGYRGKDCSKISYCLRIGGEKCPQNTTCRDIDDGHECLTPATFDGIRSIAIYNSSISDDIDINIISFRLRTRTPSGIIFHASSFVMSSIAFLSLQLINGELFIRYSSPRKFPSVVNLNGTLGYVLTDGQWHSMSIHFGSKYVTVEVDNSQVSHQEIAFSLPLTSLLREGSIYVGGAERNLLENSSFFSQNSSFKGCLDEVRVEDFLLPFLPLEQYQNNRSLDQFFVQNIQVDIACRSQPSCAKDTCGHNGLCTDIWNAYNCSCLLGFTGPKCEININECEASECLNGATCIDGIGNYSCSCVPGFTGKLCEENIDECKANQCHNNATCVDLINDYFCNCTGNFTGKYCNISIFTDCSSSPCQHGSTCENKTAVTERDLQFECLCAKGYQGTTCEDEYKFCTGNNCSNGATCVENRKDFNYNCSCAIGWQGIYCDYDINECELNVCENGATCTNLDGNYTCHCPTEWTGTNCTTDVDECLETPCQNNGVCNNTLGSFMCSCNGTGYTGLYCEEDIDECEVDKPCLNNASCTNLNGTHECTCMQGYNGSHCQIPDCEAVNCGNGTCNITATSQWICHCPEHHGGMFCEDISLCLSSPCQNNGICHGNTTTFNCQCPNHYEGEFCEKKIDYCASNPCSNGSTCRELEGSLCPSNQSCLPYQCLCINGFTGPHCETNIDECFSNPCIHGSCIDDINSFKCNCNPGYTGQTCSDKINECERQPCNNSGVCINLNGSYECNCTAEFVGTHCEIPHPCVGSPCKNGGTCELEKTNNNYHFKCKCSPGYEDEICNKKTTDHQIASNNDDVSIIVGVTVGGTILLIAMGVIAFFMMARKKRATRGTYSPSRQEVFGSRVEMGHMMKPPPEERLI